MVRHYICAHLQGRGAKWVRWTEVGVVVGRIVVGVKEEMMAFTFCVKYVTKSSAVRQEGERGRVG